MISKLSGNLVKVLIKNNKIRAEEQELYEYGVYVLLTQLFFFCVSCACGFLFGVPVESIIYYISFQFIRKYAGGYHAKTETRCQIFSSLSIIGCIALMKIAYNHNLLIAAAAFVAAASLLIIAFAPLDTPEKPLTAKEYKHFRKISVIILAVIDAAIVLSMILKMETIYEPLVITLLFEAVLLTAGKIQKLKNTRLKLITNQ